MRTRKFTLIFFSAVAILSVSILMVQQHIQTPLNGDTKDMSIQLPQPSTKSGTSVEEALTSRRSIRSYNDRPLTLDSVSQLMWSAQGITGDNFFRTAPSPGALYPLEVYIVVKHVTSLEAGVYVYEPVSHSLRLTARGNVSDQLASASLGQSAVSRAPAVIVIAAEYERVTGKYKNRGIRYTHMEAGHVSQNIYLQCESLDLGTVAIGAFDDEKVANILKMKKSHAPLYIMPIGHP